MMYWDFPSVSAADRLERSSPLIASTIRISPSQAWQSLGRDDTPASARLGTLDGRPVYRFTADAPGSQPGTHAVVYADDGSIQQAYPKDMLLRIAAAWVRQSADTASAREVAEPDQWTVATDIPSLRPLWKYTFQDGQQVYVSGFSGEVVQYTTTGSRLGAWLGAIPHWLYFTPIRAHQKLWTSIVIWLSGLGTVMALMGLVVGISMYSPSKRYRYHGVPTGIPYKGPKRLHMILGLFFGIVTCTWSFSGMLSMEPPFLTPAPARETQGGPVARIQDALRPGPIRLETYVAKPPNEALLEIGNSSARELEFTSFAGEPVYIASRSTGGTQIVPVTGKPEPEFDSRRIFDIVTAVAGAGAIKENRLLTQYDAYYLDRHRKLPLPVMFVRLNDAARSQIYIDQRIGRVVAQHSDLSSFTTRWLYHGLHSMDLPWLYNHRPAWDIVVLLLMLGGLSLCVTSVIIGWQLLRRILLA